jgi:uncharacterized Rmd1/YagE family protein
MQRPPLPTINEERMRLVRLGEIGYGSATISQSCGSITARDQTTSSSVLPDAQSVFRANHSEKGTSASGPPRMLRSNYSVDEFADNNAEQMNLQNKFMRTGRQRKKLAARSKGGEFQQKRRKRRVYFCCVTSEIDVEKLHDVFDKRPNKQWESRMYEDVLHLFHKVDPAVDTHDAYFEGSPDFTEDPLYTARHGVTNQNPLPPQGPKPAPSSSSSSSSAAAAAAAAAVSSLAASPPLAASSPLSSAAETASSSSSTTHDVHGTPRDPDAPTAAAGVANDAQDLGSPRGGEGAPVLPPADPQSAAKLWLTGGKEVFIFDFGAIVFWGFHRGEEEELLNEIRFFVVTHGGGGLLSHQEFEEGQDDMAFVTSPESAAITIANDVITLPDDASAKSRLSVPCPCLCPCLCLYLPFVSTRDLPPLFSRCSLFLLSWQVSFAIAQSTVLAIFEARIERKIEDYKYIPETLAERGKLKLTTKQLGGMIGEVYVIRHDVNLHSEILDTPDFFWKEPAAVEEDYRLTMRYLEMDTRTEILNKRLDMLRELLGVLQQQHENGHAMKLEWIVIWLIVVSSVIEAIDIMINLSKK